MSAHSRPCECALSGLRARTLEVASAQSPARKHTGANKNATVVNQITTAENQITTAENQIATVVNQITTVVN